LFLISCVSLTNTKEIAFTTNTLVQQYDLVKLVVSSKFDNLSKENKQDIFELQSHIDILIKQLQNYPNITNNTDFRVLYLNTMYSYSKAKSILVNNKDVFSDSENNIIIEFDKNVVKLNELINQPENIKSAELVYTIKQIISMSLVLMSSV
jgi:hypothetical protein